MNKLQRGSTGLISLIVVALIVWGGYATIYAPYQNRKAVDEFRAQPPKVSAAKMAIIDTYKLRQTPAVAPQGLYIGTTQQDGHPMSISFHFGNDQVLSKRAEIKGYQFSGSARYQFSGAVMLFNNVQGDKVLFPLAGEPLDVISETEIHVPGPDTTLVLIRQ